MIDTTEVEKRMESTAKIRASFSLWWADQYPRLRKLPGYHPELTLHIAWKAWFAASFSDNNPHSHCAKAKEHAK